MCRTPKHQMDKETANSLFVYNNGKLSWRPGKRHKAGNIAGSMDNAGYMVVRVGNTPYKAHNIVWNMHYGIIEKGKSIDHINMKKDDNRLSNLRLATPTQQMINRPIAKNNKSGHKNINFDNKRKSWKVIVQRDRKSHYIGNFIHIDKAIIARDKFIEDYNHAKEATS